MPANPDLRQRILNTEVYLRGEPFTAGYLADSMKADHRAVGAILGHLARQGKITRLEETNARGTPMFCKTRPSWLRKQWRRYSNARLGITDYANGRGI